MYKVLISLTVFLYIFLVGAFSSCIASPYLGCTIQRAWNTPDTKLIYSVSTLMRSKINWQYYELGCVILPSFHTGTIHAMDNAVYHKKYDRSFYGVYCGYFVMVSPLFRPGILVGSLLASKETYSSTDGSSYALTDYSALQLDYYTALEVHVGIFTFHLSNKGIGGGLNVNF